MKNLMIFIILLFITAGCITTKGNLFYRDSYSVQQPRRDNNYNVKEESKDYLDVLNNEESNKSYNYGIKAYQNGDYKNCIKKLDYAIDNLKSDTEKEEANVFSGAAYYLLGNYEKAKDKFKAILSKNKDYKINDSIFKPEVVDIFEKCRNEVK